MSKPAPTSNEVMTTYFTRQPIFSSDYSVWGYELLFSTSQGHELDALVDMGPSDPDTRSTITSLCEAGKMICVDFRQNALSALPPDKTIIIVPDQKHSNDMEMVFTLLRRRGYKVAVEIDFYSSMQDSSAPLADYVLVNSELLSLEQVEEIAGESDTIGAHVIARHIQDRFQLAETREAGCSLFQGPFFAIPENLDRREMTSHEASRFRLLQIIEHPSGDFDELAHTIQNDAALSYRLLTYLNSAAFSFPDKINTIKQAVVLLGWKQLRRWLRIIVFTDLNPDVRTEELLITALKRAKFFETLARERPTGTEPDSLFLLGLFSMLESILEMPMQDIVGRLPLEQDLKDALLGRDTPNTIWLTLATAYELASWDTIDATLSELGIAPDAAATAYTAALEWADAFTRNAAG